MDFLRIFKKADEGFDKEQARILEETNKTSVDVTESTIINLERLREAKGEASPTPILREDMEG